MSVDRTQSPTESPRVSKGGSKDVHSADFTNDDQNRIWDDLPKHLRPKKRTAYIRRHSDFSVSSGYRKFMLLMWKNYIVTQRRWKLFLVQFLSPILFITILQIMTAQRTENLVPATKFPPFQIDELPEGAFKHCSTFYLYPNVPMVSHLQEELEEVLTEEFLVAGREKDYDYKVINYTIDIVPSDLCVLIQFVDAFDWPVDHFPVNIKYELRFPAVQDPSKTASLRSIGKEWDTAYYYSTRLNDGPREIDDPTGGHPGYYKSGFLFMQHFIGVEISREVYVTENLENFFGNAAFNASEKLSLQTILTEKFEKDIKALQEGMTFRLNRFPFPAHSKEGAVEIINEILPIIIVVSYGISSMTMTYLSVKEKEMGVRDLLKMYGVSMTYHRYAWLLHNLVIQTLSTMLFTAVLSTNWSRSGPGLFTDVVSYVVFVLLLCYTFCLFCTVNLMVCFFSRAPTAVITLGFVWTVLYVPYIYLHENLNILNFLELWMASNSMNTAIAIACHIISKVEALDEGLHWGTVFGENLREFSLGWVMVAMVLVGLVQLLFAEYVSTILPDTGSTPLPWNYIFKSWYWKGELPPDEVVSSDKTNEKSFEEDHPEYFEDDKTIHRRKEMSIDKLSKYHGKLRALHKVNLLCHQGHITVLLGDVGSGKSTLLKMLNGTSLPTGGSIILSRKDLYKNPILGRAFIGYCPSGLHLFPDLTVVETLQFFTDLKGLANRIEAYEEVERFLRLTMLGDFRDTKVGDLTISSQRMLMVATAFCGGSRIVLLDEPTIHLSAAQRRVLWEFAGQEKKYRTILCSMDLVHEVDSVVDKIVLLHCGQVTARGTPEFLQANFGGGYHLEIETLPKCNQQTLEQLITRRINGSWLYETCGKTLDFYLPSKETSSFPGLLEEFETTDNYYKIANFKMKYVTLEELHLKLKRASASLDDLISKRHIEEFELERGTAYETTEAFVRKDYQPSSGLVQSIREFLLMFLKNVRYSMRRKGLIIFIFFILFGFLTLSHFLTQEIELKPNTEKHMLDYKQTKYQNPYIITDILKATNEGRRMRDSVRFLLNKDHHITSKEIPFTSNIQQVLLHEYETVDNELEIPSVGIQIAPVQIRVGNHEEFKVGITGHFNNQPLHTPGVVVNLMDNVLLDHVENYIIRRAEDIEKLKAKYSIQHDYKYVKKRYTIEIWNHPLTYQPADLLRHSALFVGSVYLFGICVALSYSFAYAALMIFHVKEQSFRHIQFMAGANKFIFWAASYSWNTIGVICVSSLHLVIVAVGGVPGIQRESWKHFELLPTMFIFLVIYGVTFVCITGAYASRNFKSWGRAYSRVCLFSIITGPLLMFIMMPLDYLLPSETLRFLHLIFMFLPPYAFGTGIFYIVNHEIHRLECANYFQLTNAKCPVDLVVTPFNEFSHAANTLESCCYNDRRAPFSFIAYGIGRNIAHLILCSVISVAYKIFTHTNVERKLRKKLLDKLSMKWDPLVFNEHEIKDYDVITQTVKIQRGESKHDLVVKNLTIENPLYVKVDNMCLGLSKGDCFALIGALGAGKSTLLKVLSGIKGLLPTCGDVELNGISLLNEFTKFSRLISYSPDENPFLEEMSGQEVLELLGAIRRMPSAIIQAYIIHVAKCFGIRIEIEQLVKTYSHVLIKKLCMACALLERNDVLLLDEPTEHMDPNSVQFIMNSVRDFMREGTIVIWAAHRIEQCEEICTKMSIMVNGHLRCLGSVGHLRSLYEEGYTVIVRFILDKDMIYFTSKKNVRLENEIRENDVDEVTGKAVGVSRQEVRMKEFAERIHEKTDNVELALTELVPWEQDLCPFVAFFERAFPNAMLIDKQPSFIHYHIHKKDATWSELFRKMEEAKTVVEVEGYYIACTNLDQVYFNFTRGQFTFD